MTGLGACARTWARAWIVLAATGLLVGGFVACRADPVIIGIETDGGPLQFAGPHPPVDHDADVAPDAWAIGDAGFDDADKGQCLPDAGCPPASICYYLVVEAGCPLPGECFASGGPANPPPPPPAPQRRLPLGVDPSGGAAEPRRVPRVFDAPYGYTAVRPDCGVDDSGPPEPLDGGIP